MAYDLLIKGGEMLEGNRRLVSRHTIARGQVMEVGQDYQ